MKRKLKKVYEEGWVGGVCAGIGYWLGFPTWLIRLGLVLSVLVYGAGVCLYILLWIFMPKWKVAPNDYKKIAE